MNFTYHFLPFSEIKGETEIVWYMIRLEYTHLTNAIGNTVNLVYKDL